MASAVKPPSLVTLVLDTKNKPPPPIAQPASVAGWQSKQKLFETSTPLSSSWHPGVASDIMWLSYFCWNQNKISSLVAWSFKKFNRLILSCHQFYLQIFQSLRMFNRSRRGSRIRESNQKKLNTPISKGNHRSEALATSKIGFLFHWTISLGVKSSKLQRNTNEKSPKKRRC